MTEAISMRDRIRYFFYSLFILVVAFPFIPTDNSIGLDASYMWAFNYFFEHGMHAGTDFIFTYGPLGFVKNPLPVGNNMEIAFGIILFFRLLFVYSVFTAGRIVSSASDVFSFVLAMVLSLFFKSIDFVLIGIVILHCLMHCETKQSFNLVVIALAGIAGLMIKLNIGITCAFIGLSYLLYDFSKGKSFKTLFHYVIVHVSVLLISWFLIYHDFEGVIPFFKNTFLIASGNIGATSVNTPNNWTLLFIAFGAYVLFPFISSERKIWLLYLITALAFFGYFRYSFAREENYHMLGLMYFMILITGVSLMLLYESLSVRKIIWLLIPLLFYNLNMHESGAYHLEDKVEYIGINNFRKQVWHFDEWKKESIKQSESNIAASKLSDSWLKRIGNNTVDCFPWELSFIPANNLNYHPRPLIQLGCATNFVLDERNAAFIKSGNAPRFIVWHKGWCDDRLCSIDERYLLSDDLLTMTAILNRYRIVDSAGSLFLLERVQSGLYAAPKDYGTSTGIWNEWIACPATDSTDVVLANVFTRRTLAGRLKVTLFKEHVYYIEYKLADDRVIRHRYIKESSQSGIWIKPYLFQLNAGLTGYDVKAIRFIPTNQSTTVDPVITVEWKRLIRK